MPGGPDRHGDPEAVGVVVVDNLRKPELSVGVDVALERLASICKRDGYVLASANLRLIDEALDIMLDVMKNYED